MSGASSIVSIIVVLALIAGGVYWFMSGQKAIAPGGEAAPQDEVEMSLSTIDAELEMLEADDANVNESLSDTPEMQAAL